jgi:hypothetical protein
VLPAVAARPVANAVDGLDGVIIRLTVLQSRIRKRRRRNPRLIRRCALAVGRYASVDQIRCGIGVRVPGQYNLGVAGQGHKVRGRCRRTIVIDDRMEDVARTEGVAGVDVLVVVFCRTIEAAVARLDETGRAKSKLAVLLQVEDRRYSAARRHLEEITVVARSYSTNIRPSVEIAVRALQKAARVRLAAIISDKMTMDLPLRGGRWGG